MTEILTLKPEDEKRLHIQTLVNLNVWRAGIIREVPQLTQLDIDEINADVNTQLNEDEKVRFRKCIADVMEYLRNCMDIGDGYSPYPYSTWIIRPMSELRQLIKTAYERKAAKAEAERKKKLEEDGRQAAVRALKPPVRDAHMFLNHKEYNKFEGSISGAIDAYLTRGESYISDSRARAYFQWCTTIRNRQEEKERKRVAERKRWQYNHSLNEEIRRLKSTLYSEKQSPEDYFEKGTVDLRYMGQNFFHLIADEEKQALLTAIDRITRAKLDKMVPQDFSQFIDWEYRTYCFLLPSADYSAEGVACLDFYFDVFSVVEVQIWVKPGEKRFDDYIFSLPWLEENGYAVWLDEPKFLGYRYLLFTPYELGVVFWQTIPLILVSGLANGDSEPSGTTIVEASEAETTYRIDNFKEKVTIPESFAGYLKETWGIDGMETPGILSERVANIVKNKLGQLGDGENQPLQNSQATGFTDEELVSSLTALGTPVKDAKKLLKLVPRNLALPEAIKLALKKHSEIIAQQHS